MNLLQTGARWLRVWTLRALATTATLGAAATANAKFWKERLAQVLKTAPRLAP